MAFTFVWLTYRLFCCGLCGALILICRRCDCGHRYCSKACSQEARRENRCLAQENYQRDNPVWKEAHRNRQRALRRRRRNRALGLRVLERQRMNLRRRAIQRERAAKRMRTTRLRRGDQQNGTTVRQSTAQALVPAPLLGVTDHSLASPAARINVSVSDPAEAEDLGEQSTEARFMQEPMCCSFCRRVLPLFANVHTWHSSA